MKSYLSLIPISAKVHKRQNRMTILCIIFAVFLVTAIFSMAERIISELVTLQSVVICIIPDFFCLRLEATQSFVSTYPEFSIRVFQNPVHYIVGKSVGCSVLLEFFLIYIITV